VTALQSLSSVATFLSVHSRFRWSSAELDLAPSIDSDGVTTGRAIDKPGFPSYYVVRYNIVSHNIKVIHFDNIAKVTLHSVPDEPGVAAQVFSQLGNHGITAELISQSSRGSDRADISLAVVELDLGQTVNLFQRIKDTIGATKVSFTRDVAMISIYGSDLGARSGVAGQIFSALASKGANIEMISTSLSSISCVVHKKKLNTALSALNTLLTRGKTPSKDD
jgi:aspartate kinase